MLIDLLHNKIVRETVTERFTDSVKENLCPLVADVFGDSVVGICMYEDYIADGFLSEGEWYYPLTVMTEDSTSTLWIKWCVEPKSAFKGGVPYSYLGEELLEFSVAENVPDAFIDAMQGRAISYTEQTITVKVHSDVADPLFLCGKYSQTFVDEMARQITSELSRALAVEGIADTTMELQLVVAPMTYMEHTSENVTYRRLLLTDKSCRPRDFWIKWTRLDGAVSYSITDVVDENTICFELGEDVPQKIREKEYRYLCAENPDKYQSAMGKKTVTEWREIIKRAIRRGDLVKIVTDLEIEDQSSDVNDKLAQLLGSFGMTSTTEEPVTADDNGDFDLMALARAALGEVDEDEIVDEDEVAEENSTEDEEALEELRLLDEDLDASESEEEIEDSEDDDFAQSEDEAEEDEEEPRQEESADLSNEDARLRAEEERILREQSIRAEIEARIRLEYETEARARAEEEARRLREEREALRAENERLAAAAKLAEEQRAMEESARLAEIERNREEAERRRLEEEKLRAQLEEQKRQEARERDRLAEAARIAVEEQRRIEAEKAAREAREREAIVRREAERLAREEAARLEAERQREIARITGRADTAPAAPVAAPVVEETYISKSAKLLFRYNIDLNVIKRIKEIVEETLVVLHKENVPIHIKASPKDATTIQLDIMRLPSSEQELLVKIIRAIGEGNIGIYKIILE